MSSDNRLAGALVATLLGTAMTIGTGVARAAHSPVAATARPVAVVRETSTELLHALNENRSKLKKDPELARKLVRQYLLPNFDFKFTSQLVLGRYWRTASPRQRKAFSSAFLHYLTQTYATGLKHYNGAKVKVFPFRGDTQKQYVTVRTRVETPGHSPVSVAYALHKTSHGWKAFDVKIAGVSYVQTYRDEFQAEIQRSSLQALISRLRHAKAPRSLTPAKPASGGP